MTEDVSELLNFVITDVIPPNLAGRIVLKKQRSLMPLTTWLVLFNITALMLQTAKKLISI